MEYKGEKCIDLLYSLQRSEVYHALNLIAVSCQRDTVNSDNKSSICINKDEEEQEVENKETV